jgi:hypothetical protein
MKYTCVRTCGTYRKGHEYELERPLPVLAMSAIRAGHLVASGGWCAPSEVIYSTAEVLTPQGLIELPAIRPKKATKPRKKVAVDTLESLAEQTAAGLDGLRGPASV